MARINVQNLTVTYQDKTALTDLSVEIPENRLTVIIGPSGCGKTTFLRSLNRLNDLDEDVRVMGEVFIGGKDIYDPGIDVLLLRRHVGFLAQRPYPLPMSIYDNVAFGPRIHGMNAAAIMRTVKRLHENGQQNGMKPALNVEEGKLSRNGAMDLLVENYLRMAGLWNEIKDRLRSPASQLSVGQQQRLALARALAVQPTVLLADEPTSALDPLSARLIEDQFRCLKKDYTIVVVTHILRQARRIADHVIFLYLGELIEHGPAEQVFAHPRDERTRAYLAGEFIEPSAVPR